MIVVVNYANGPYKSTQNYCTKSAYKYGAEKVYEYGPESIDSNFYEKNKSILDQKRGGGYWLWKPYVIDQTLKKINFGDYLLYVDSGSYFINRIETLIECMERNNDDIISFEIPFIEKQWTKYEILKYFECENDTEITDTCQRIATFIVLKKTKKTIKFIEHYLKVAQFERLITDDIDVSRQDKDFIENRHDQSIFSVLAKKEGIPVYKDPSEYGVQPELLFESYPRAFFKKGIYKHGDYEQVLVLHRKKKVTIYVKIISIIRSKFSWRLYRKLLKVQNILSRKLRGK